jgi:hypothetical protein
MLPVFGCSRRLARAFVHLRRELPSLEGIDSACIYGPWAARAKGSWRARPGDTLDMVVIGRVDDTALAALGREATEKTGLTVSRTEVSIDDWRSEATGFVRSVKAAPLLELG